MSTIVSSPAAPSAAGLQDEAPPSSWTRWFTRLSVVVGAIALVVTVWSVGPSVLLDNLKAIGWGFALIIAIEAAVTGCDGAALSGFLGKGGRRPSFGYVLRAQVIGRAINAVTPLASLGEATKATTLMERTSSPRAIGAVLRYNLAHLGVRLTTIALGAPICALVLDVPSWMTWLLVGGSIAAIALVIAGAVLVKRGMLASVVGVLRALRLVSGERARRWDSKLEAIDERLRDEPGARGRARWSSVCWVFASRALTLTSAWVVLMTMGHSVGVGTVAAISTAGQLVAVAASLVPLGLGIAEAGNAALFTALGEPAALGVAMVLGTRITTIVYAAIGLILTGTTVVGSRR